MNPIEILSILFIHWFADFVLQTDKMAQGKSKSNKWLLLHTANYAAVWYIIGAVVYYDHFLLVTYFALITFAIHTVTDYFTSRLNSYLWNSKQVHKFFVSVGFDQWLHYLQLFLTYHILFK